MKAEAQKLQARARISPQNSSFFDPRTISASLRLWAQATIGEVRDSPCQMKEKLRATSPLAPSSGAPSAEMMKYAGTIGLRTVATPAVAAARATEDPEDEADSHQDRHDRKRHPRAPQPGADDEEAAGEAEHRGAVAR